MFIGINGIIVNESGQVLLIRRDDTGNLAPPGGSLEAGELPPEGMAREALEETGLKVMPARLVGLHFLALEPGYLTFVFRCLQKGGELQTSEESPEVGFYKTEPFPGPMFSAHRERVARGLTHVAARPYWGTYPSSWRMRWGRWFLRNVTYRLKDWQRRRDGRPPFAPPPAWRVGAFAIIQNEAGQVLWARRTDRDLWNLPGGRSEAMEPPWATAVRETQEETGLQVELNDLTGVYLYRERAHLIFVFTAVVTGGALTTGPESCELAYFAPDGEPENSVPQHRQRVADALNFADQVQFRWQTPWKTE